jgi:hypothetical protein
LHRLAYPQVIEVGTVHHDLLPKAGIGSAKQPGDVGALEPVVHTHRADGGAHRQVEDGRLPRFSGGQNLI